ncbi:MAG TPA: helix-turn-helix transcriptional regulator [Solirubrobacteraceae bacterium]|nr:helix-turn-helix transcriptional regulator [Solirubrobacteraceae bacterium]
MTPNTMTRNTKKANTVSTSATDLAVLGQALRVLRERAGTTQARLAAVLQMDPTYVSRIEHGRRGVQWLTVLRFLRALDVDLHQLADAMTEVEKPRRARK